VTTPAASEELIALIGPRGSGKTTLARLLADRLGWQWADADQVLEEQAGRRIRDIFAAEGETGFREREAAILRDLCRRRALVLATGGGVVVREENRALLRASARVIWLTADADTLWRRIEGDAASAGQRPALRGGGRAEVEEVLHTREPLYRACAHLKVTTAGRQPGEIVAEILATGTPSRPTANSTQD
jgi:shikimate kinase